MEDLPPDTGPLTIDILWIFLNQIITFSLCQYREKQEEVIMKIKDLNANEQSVIRCLIVNIEGKSTKNGEAFCTLTMTDGETQINGNLFRVRKDQIFDRYNEHVADVTIGYDGKFYNVLKLSYVEDADITEFVIRAPMGGGEMYAEIMDTLKQCAEECSAAKIAIKLYEDNKRHLLYWSAAKSIHHNIRAGLLWHVYRMLKSAAAIADVYSGLNKPLLLTGVAIHDIGKLVELDATPLGSATYSVDGSLFGHLLIGIEMVEEAASQIPDIDPEELRQLKHMIASHHGNPEWGAITRPSTPEAIALFYVDNLDAKMFMCERELKDIEPGTCTKTVFALETALYKPVA